MFAALDRRDWTETRVDRADRYAWWVVAVLTLVYSISYIDRQMLSLLIGPIRRDLHISDTQIGLLTGFAFAGVYAVLGVLLGRIADTRNRIGLISMSLAIWSLATAACGLAASYNQLLLARLILGKFHPQASRPLPPGFVGSTVRIAEAIDAWLRAITALRGAMASHELDVRALADGHIARREDLAVQHEGSGRRQPHRRRVGPPVAGLGQPRGLRAAQDRRNSGP